MAHERQVSMQVAIERALLDFFKAHGVPVRPDGLGDHHIVVASKCGELPGLQTVMARLPTRCPMMVQVGEDCGMTMERLNLSDIAKFLEREMF